MKWIRDAAAPQWTPKTLVKGRDIAIIAFNVADAAIFHGRILQGALAVLEANRDLADIGEQFVFAIGFRVFLFRTENGGFHIFDVCTDILYGFRVRKSLCV